MTKGLVVIAIVLVTATVWAQEQVTLTTPEVVSSAAFSIKQIVLDADGVITIQLNDDVGSKSVHCVYSAATTPTGAILLTALNKANLSTTYAGNATTGSLKQRIYHRLVVMGEASAVCGRSLVGSLTGSVP